MTAAKKRGMLDKNERNGSMGKTFSISALIVFLILSLLGCSMATRRANGRAESHVKYHAKRVLKCRDKPLNAKCVAEYKSGECYEFQVEGCDAKVVFRNVTGAGWTTGS